MKNFLCILALWVIAILLRPAGGILHLVAILATLIWVVGLVKKLGDAVVSVNLDNVDS